MKKWMIWIAGLLASLAVLLWWMLPLETNRFLVGLFGPPKVEASERYASAGETFDHSAFDKVLSAHVSADGWVDYATLKAAAKGLDTYLAQLAKAPVDRLSRDEALALMINAYNAFTLKLMIERWPIASIKDISTSERWADPRWDLGGERLSLDALEHERLRAHFVEPRIHFAIVCASVGCPPLRNTAYTGENIESALSAQSAKVHQNGSRWLRIDGDTLWLTPLYLWFEGDLVSAGQATLQAVKARSPQLDLSGVSQVRWLNYDWHHNGRH